MKTFKVKSVKRGQMSESLPLVSIHIALVMAEKKVNEGCNVVTITAAESTGINAGKYFLERIVK